MPFDVIQSYRFGEDKAQIASYLMGTSPYTVNLVSITNDQVDINDNDSSRSISITRLTVADGYISYGPPELDGYINPIINQKKGEQLTISAGKLTANELIIGPLVFPYSLNNLNGGIDPNLFQPAIGANNNVTLYLQIGGPGLSPTANFFTIKEIKLGNMSNIYYYVVLDSNNLTVSLS